MKPCTTGLTFDPVFLFVVTGVEVGTVDPKAGTVVRGTVGLNLCS